MTLPALPHIGSTGVINQPGLREGIQDAMASLPQILLAVQEQKAAEKRARVNEAYMNNQIEIMRAKALNEQAQWEANQKMQGLIGGGLKAIAGYDPNAAPTTSGEPDVTTPGATELPGVSVTAPSRTFDDLLAGIDPSALPQVLEQGKDLIKSKREEEKASKEEQAFQKALASLPEPIRDRIATIAALPDSVGAGVKEQLLEGVLGGSSDKTKQLILSGLDRGMTMRQAKDFATGTGGPGDLFKKPASMNPLVVADYKNTLEKTKGQAGPTEHKAYRNGIAAYKAARVLESPVKTPPRAVVLAMTAKKRTLAELFKASAGKEYGQWFTAMRNFVDPLLRTDTGAAFAESEPQTFIDRYVDMADDDAATKKYKAENRRDVLNAVFGEAGRAVNNLLEQGRLKQTDWDEMQSWLEGSLTPPVITKLKLEPATKRKTP